MTEVKNNFYEIIVLIPHYNNLKGLHISLASIKYDGKLLVLIIDDGSDLDFSISEFDLYNLEIHVLASKNNLGIESALNKGLVFIKENLQATYIARLDCGDKMHHSRLNKQARFLDKNKDVSLLGSWVEFFDEDGTLFILKPPTEHNVIKRRMMLGVCFIHPAVIFRSSLVDIVGLYPVDYPAAEDYAYFIKIARNLTTANLPEVLTFVESNKEGISISKRQQQLDSRLKIIWYYREFSIYFLVGVVKLVLLKVLPYKFIVFIKKVVYK